jgi:hypothetical protein
MKTKLPALLLVLLTSLELWAQTQPSLPPPPRTPRASTPRFGGTNTATTQPRFPTPPTLNPAAGAAANPSASVAAAAGTASSTDASAQPEEMIPAGTINFQDVDVSRFWKFIRSSSAARCFAETFLRQKSR